MIVLAACGISAAVSAQSGAAQVRALVEEVATRVAGADPAQGRAATPSTRNGTVQVTIDLKDSGSYPVRVTLAAGTRSRPSHVVYLLPGGGVNYQSSYLVPAGDNLTRFFVERGALVVGINYREDAVPAGLPSYAFMRGWGLEQHSKDVRAVVKLVQAVTRLPYDMLGHSYGAAVALDYASRHSDVRRLFVLDIYSVDPSNEVLVQGAEATYQAHVGLIAQGVHHDETYSGLRGLVLLAATDPHGDSGVSRAELGFAGNFTNEGLLYFGFVNNALLPGIHTPITELPGDWLLQRGLLAGDYELQPDPIDDAYTFTLTALSTVQQAAALTGSGLVPMALARDIWGMNSGDYDLRWHRIKAEVRWINTELGYNVHTHGARRIADGGNERVSVEVIPGYAHVDIIWADDARADVWESLLD